LPETKAMHILLISKTTWSICGIILGLNCAPVWQRSPQEIRLAEAYSDFLDSTRYTRPVIIQLNYDSDVYSTATIKPYVKGSKGPSRWTILISKNEHGKVVQKHIGSPIPEVSLSKTRNANLIKASKLATQRIEYLGQLRTPCIVSPERFEREYLISFDGLPLLTDNKKIIAVSFDLKRVTDP